MKQLIAIGLPISFLAHSALYAQAYEYDPIKGYHQEEWYDPSDWFDDDSAVDYEYDDTFDYTYYSPYWDSSFWYGDINYEYVDDDLVYGTHYVWNEATDEWVVERGFYDTAYSYDVQWDDDDLMSASDSDSDNKQSSDSDSSMQASADSDSSSQMKKSSQDESSETLSGTVEGFRKMDLEYSSGYTANHALARIALEDGSKAVIDLGYSPLLNAELQKGDEVTLQGSRGSINGQSIFVVSQLESGGETHHIDRALELSQQSSGSTAAKQRWDDSSENQMEQDKSAASSITIDGTLEDHKMVNIDGESNTFLKLRMKNGKAATIDLGANTKVSDLNLENGDNIRVRGEKTKINDRTVISARSISVEGEQVKG
ncbi:hypothetical protein [Pelagicoccus sp. SDUM812003]|uniref:hypothetical protein n=1 Tax=Pelagicoccus sp. SDUM812003 TaxID=3041267 RepID=UPI0028106068|nr:hypothetical protein [Pelagicoccus sp. SDUM812003]MDQ8204322.1 hypothetical protein [Pelagicoccus sp. SDUM812003]